MRIVLSGCASFVAIVVGFASCTVSTTGGQTSSDGGLGGIGNVSGSHLDGGAGTTGVEGGGSADGASAAACGTLTASDACGACELGSCCASILACSADTTCDPCLSSPTAACESNANFNAAVACVGVQCDAVCSAGADGGGTANIGDKCSGDTDCASGICAGNAAGVGLWCASLCTTSQQCGASSAGVANVCGATTTAGQAVCFPTCTTTAQCQAFGASATCVSGQDVEGTTVTVCTGN